jgi:hypothetical protein
MESFCKELLFFRKTYSNINPAQTLEIMNIIVKLMSNIVLVPPIMFSSVLYARLPVDPDALLVRLATGLSSLCALVKDCVCTFPLSGC